MTFPKKYCVQRLPLLQKIPNFIHTYFSMKTLLLLLLTLPLSASDLNMLTPEEKADGWELLFNGKDLSNWRTFGTQNRPGPGWNVDQGILKKAAKVPGGNIITKKKFKDFTLIWEWRISENGNNGIKYLIDEKRAKAPGPEFQMLDDSGHPDGKIGPKRQTASLYDIFPPAADKLLKPVGEWNRSRIIVQGNIVQHWLNGAPVLEYELGSPELAAAIEKSKFKNAQGFGTKIEGPIMLTDHYDECSFRNMKIRPGLFD